MAGMAHVLFKHTPEHVVWCLGGVWLHQEPLGLGSTLCQATSGMVLAVFSLGPASDMGAGWDERCILWWVMGGGQEMPSLPPSIPFYLVNNRTSGGFVLISINYPLFFALFFLVRWWPSPFLSPCGHASLWLDCLFPPKAGLTCQFVMFGHLLLLLHLVYCGFLRKSALSCWV